MLSIIRRLQHYFELPEESLEEIQARYREAEGRDPNRRQWHECSYCQVLVSGAHKCEETRPTAKVASIRRSR